MVKQVLVFFFCLMPAMLMAQSSITDTAKTDTTGQRDIIDIVRSVFNIKPRTQTITKKRFYFSVFPVSTTDGRSGGKALFTSTTAGFYLGDQSTTNISSISFTPYFNLKGRYGLPINSNIWFNNNDWNIHGDTRMLVYPQYTWGLGGKQPSADKFLVDYKYIRVYQSLLAKVKPYLYAGIGYALDYYTDIESQGDANLYNFTGYQYGTTANKNVFSSGVTFNLLLDSRKNSINPLPGMYANVVYRVNTRVLGSQTHWESLYLDVRKYVSITHSGPKNVLAFWTYFWTSLTPGTPYLNLPSLGWESGQRSGRGFPQSRYRGQRLAYFETEYRPARFCAVCQC